MLKGNWKTRVKGRDFYDFIWYIANDIPCHLRHLENRMKQTGHLQENESLSLERLCVLLSDRFSQVDFKKAQLDVKPFIHDQSSLTLWSEEFFLSLIEKVKTISQEV